MTLYRRQGSRPSPWKRNAKRQKWLSEEALQIAEKRRQKTVQIVPDVVRDDAHEALARLDRRPGDMRRHDAVFRVEQGTVRRHWLGGKHVDASAAELPALQCAAKILLDHHAAARGIDKQRAGLHFGKRLAVKHPGRVGVQRTVHGSRVFSNTTVQKHQFFGAQPSSQSNSHIHT